MRQRPYKALTAILTSSGIIALKLFQSISRATTGANKFKGWLPTQMIPNGMAVTVAGVRARQCRC